MAVAKTMLAPPPDEETKWMTPEQKEELHRLIARVNGYFTERAATLGKEGDRLRRWVHALIVSFAAVTVLGGLALLLYVILRDPAKINAVTVSALAAVTASPILASMFVNPLAVLERSHMFSAWVETILATYSVRMAVGSSDRQYASAMRAANDQFSALATAYAAVVAKQVELVQALQPTEGQGSEDEEEDEEEDQGDEREKDS